MTDPTETYRLFSEFYDMYTGQFSDDLDFYKAYCDKSDKMIEIGCGTGRILESFLKSGYAIDGLDVSQEMLDKAEAKLGKWINAEKLKLFKHDFSSGKLGKKYDKALISFYTFNYIINNPAGFLRNVYESLNDNGLILMDLFYPNSLYDKTNENKWIDKVYTVNGKTVKIKDHRQVTDDMEHRQQIFYLDNKEIKIDTYRKYYSPEMMKALLAKAGFTDIKLAPGYDLNVFSEMIDESILKSNYIIKAKKRE